MTIKGNSAILNFPELVGSLPRPVSLSPHNVQAAAAKTVAVDKFDLPSHSSSSSNMSLSSSSSLASLDSGIVLSATGLKELSEIVELPSLGIGFDLVGLKNDDFVYVYSVNGWIYPPLWMDRYCGGGNDDVYFSGQENVIATGFESLLWNY